MLEIVNLVLREGGITCSYAFLGICEAIFRGRDLFFCVEPHIIIYFTDIKYFFNFDNLEPAPGRLAPELEVKARKIFNLDVLEQAPGCQNKKKYIRKINTNMRFHTKN